MPTPVSALIHAILGGQINRCIIWNYTICINILNNYFKTICRVFYIKSSETLCIIIYSVKLMIKSSHINRNKYKYFVFTTIEDYLNVNIIKANLIMSIIFP